jgi:AraC-like DNA-binding protein
MDESANSAAILAASVSRQSVFARPRLRQALHRHDTPRLILYLDGDMSEEAFEGETRLTRGHFFFRPAFFAHANIAEQAGSRYIRLRISDAAVRRWVRQHGWRAAQGRVLLDQDFSGDELLAAARPTSYAPYGRAGMQRAATLLTSEDAPPLKEIAARLGMPAYALTRRFTAAFGMTPSLYRRQACVQRALQMLSDGASTLAGVAAHAGFHDQSHLTTAIRRETGMTPGQVRRQYA